MMEKCEIDYKQRKISNKELKELIDKYSEIAKEIYKAMSINSKERKEAELYLNSRYEKLEREPNSSDLAFQKNLIHEEYDEKINTSGKKYRKTFDSLFGEQGKLGESLEIYGWLKFQDGILESRTSVDEFIYEHREEGHAIKEKFEEACKYAIEDDIASRGLGKFDLKEKGIIKTHHKVIKSFRMDKYWLLTRDAIEKFKLD
jgi:hypothetical protein